ncbi:hypothetical protein EMCRGX_G030021 [Ephydatia muelleri]
MKSNLDENNELQMELEKKEVELKEEKAELKKKKVELKTTIAELAGDENREGGLKTFSFLFWMYYAALAMNKSICYNQTQEADQRNHDLALARIATSIICLLLTFPILALVCAHRLFKTATQRQYLYLVLATQAYLLALAAGVDKIFTEAEVWTVRGVVLDYDLDSIENCTDIGFEYQLILNYVPTAFISFTAVILTFVTNVV